MNRIKVGNASSPNLKKVTSKVGSLANANYRPGGGDFKIKSQKLEWKAEPRTKALNEGYTPHGGQKKVRVKSTKKYQLKINSVLSSKPFIVMHW